MRKLIAVLFVLSFLGIQLISSAGANPNMFMKPRYCNISIQSPQNGTQNSAPILLNFTVKEWDISDTYSYFYILDGQDYQSGVKIEKIQLVAQENLSEEHVFSYVETTLAGQVVLPSLPDGAHNVTVFIGQVLDDGTIRPANVDPFSTTANFNVDSTIQSSPPPQETEPKPFPTTLVAATASGTSVAAVIIGLLFYLKKRNH
jgi:hypothetical protein